MPPTNAIKGFLMTVSPLSIPWAKLLPLQIFIYPTNIYRAPDMCHCLQITHGLGESEQDKKTMESGIMGHHEK